MGIDGEEVAGGMDENGNYGVGGMRREKSRSE